MIFSSGVVKIILYSVLLKIATCKIDIQNVKEKLALQARFPDSSSRCSDTLLASVGTISYKNFDSYLPNERCVWTIRAFNATSYSVHVDTLGRSGTLHVTGYGLRDLSNQNVPRGPANISVANSNVVVITFVTGAENNTGNYKGFSLRYEASFSGSNEKAAPTSEDVVVTANIGHIKYPSSKSIYGNNELSLFVVTPTSGVYSPGKKTEVIYIRSGLEDQTCQDRISVYKFEVETYGSTYSWKLMGRMCGGVDSELITSRDIIMFKFESDGSAVSYGFHLYARSV